MAMNAAEAHAMLAASQAHPNQVAQIVPSPFTFRVDRTIQDLLADGHLGELYAMTVRDATPVFADANAPLHWRQRQALGGYNHDHGHLVRGGHALGRPGGARLRTGSRVLPRSVTMPRPERWERWMCRTISI